MVDSGSSAEVAERLGRRRARLFPVLGIFLLIQQSAYFGHGGGERIVDHVRVGAWVVMSAVVLFVLTTGGFWFRGSELRAMLNDESTRANRAAALELGFVLAMATGIVLYVAQGAWQLTVGESIHLIVTAGLFAALLRFSSLERRGLG
ncbi:hypothetical protein ACFO0A_04170 [Novosphingobium tardum]|uniref:DUF2391 family protein n=1 Tax=Novosphingobium tardum TaxID=1538021 RepID=A0ABV8RNW7_9SPHN